MKLTRLNELIKDGKTVRGRWRVGKDQVVSYEALDPRETISFKGSLLAAEPEGLVLSVEETREDQKSLLSTVRLSGRWSADAKNRPSFEVEKTNGQRDTLTFKGVWGLNGSNQLVYTHEVTRLKTKTRLRREIVFQGFWDISQKNRLSYLVGGDEGSALRFRGSFQTKSILAKKGEIRYQLGAEASGDGRPQVLTLFGKWKMSDRWGLSFEMEYEKGAKRAIVFGADSKLGPKDSVEVTLKDRQGEPLGVQVLFTRELLGKDGEAFLRFLRSPEESRAEAGMRLRW